MTLRLSGMQRLSAQDPDLTDRDILCFMNVRDEALRLPYLLAQYRALGVTRFVIVDNASTDGTCALLQDASDVTLFATDESFAENRCGLNWLEALRNRYGFGKWCLTVDADEVFVFPHMQHTGLRGLADHLDSIGAQAMLALMIDCYPDGPLRAARYSAGQPFADHAPFFDRSGYMFSYAAQTGLLGAYGGARYRAFYKGTNRGRPQLRKVPFVKWAPGATYTSVNHALLGRRFADLTGAVLHYTFLEDARDMADRMVARGDRGVNAVYPTLQNHLQADPEASLFCALSERYRDPMQLFDLGLLHCTPDFSAYAARLLRKAGDPSGGAALYKMFKARKSTREAVRRINVPDMIDLWGTVSNDTQ